MPFSYITGVSAISISTTSLQYKKDEQLLQERFNNVHTLTGTQSLFSFVLVSTNKLKR
jgi:hypothetical protein